MVGVIGSLIASQFGGWDAALSTLILFMAVDYITGLVVAGVFHASPKSKDGTLESRAGWKGLCRKGVTLLIVLVACHLDTVMGSNFIRDATVIAFIANETLSIIENAYESGYLAPNPPKTRTGKRVAVVGSGPSGLSAAYWLNKRGHEVTVYERSDRPGGLLMYGIPNMKLEKWVIDRKVSIMKEEGITFVTNTNVGKDVKAAKLLKEYDRVVLACGAKNPRDIKAPGRDAKGIYFAVDFLKATTKSLLDSELKDNQYISAKGKRVVIIGGGDTGNDCVGTSIRHGAASVTQLEMMPKAPDTRAENNPWPEWPKVCKTDYGQEEAIAVFGHDPRIYQTTVKEFLKDKNGNLCGLVTVKLESKKDEKTGRMMMAEVPGSEQKMDADLVLIAAGFLGAENYIANAFGVDLNARTNVATAEGAYATNVKNVFTAGDMHRGQSLVVWAIREGREAAREVDESLMGYSYLSVQ